LADAEHVADRRRPQSRAGRGLGGDRVGGGHERIRAVVVVEQRALRAFEQDALALAALLVEQRPHRIDVRQDARRDALELLAPGAYADLFEPEPAPQRVVVGQEALDLAPERQRVGEIHDADRAPADLVLVGRADAPPGRAYARERTGGFTDRVEFLVQRQDQG